MTEEKTPDVNEQPKDEKPAAVPYDEDLDESKAQLIKSNGGAGDVVVGIIDPSGSSDGDVSFNGLGKDEVLQYANDPFWVRLRWVLFILFWVGWTAMLVTAIVIIVLAPRCPPRPDLKWYETGAVYQVNSKSFKDSAVDDKTPMDGFGDFGGLKDKIGYITDDLGLNAVYLNSMYKTDDDLGAEHLRDYAIVDHKMLHDKFGTNVDVFSDWVKDMRKKGIYVILDLIPNQTSKKHEWFQKAIKGDSKYKAFYIWASTSNDMKNMNGESAWTKDPTLNEYYYSYLTSDLPDLNLNNEAVQEEIINIMKFWLDAGVGGFRVNGLDYLVESEDVGGDNATRATGPSEGTMKLLEKMRAVINSYSDKPGRERFIFGTMTVTDVNATSALYQSDGKKKEERLNMILPELKLDGNCKAQCLLQQLAPVVNDKFPRVGLQLGNENTERIGAILGTSTIEHAIKMAHAIQMLLPGTPFSYYGDEFGQEGGNLTDIDGIYNPMNSRSPMQWNGRENAGFTDEGIMPWQPIGLGYENDNVEESQAHFKEHSVLKSFKDLLSLRQMESFQWGKLKACAPDENLFVFTRKAEGFPYFLTLINTGSEKYTAHTPSIDCVDTKVEGVIKFHSRDQGVGDKLDFQTAVYLEPGDIVVIEFPKE